MNGLDMLNTAPGAGAAGQAVAGRGGDAAPDDPGGDAPRSFDALLATFSEPAAAAADGSAQPAAATFVTPSAAVLRQALQATSEIVSGTVTEAAAELPAQAEEKTSADENAALSDDMALMDLAGGPPAPASQQDAATPSQGIPSWSAAVNGAIGLM